MKYTGTTLTNTEAHALHSRNGKANGVNTLRARTRWHTRPFAIWSNPFGLTGVQNMFMFSKNLQNLIGLAWTSTLTGSDRAAWSALAAVQPITLNDGTMKLTTGQRMFSHVAAQNYMLATNALQTLPHGVSGEGYTAPVVWAPLTVTAGPFAISPSVDGVIFASFTTTPLANISSSSLLVPNPNPKAKQPVLPNNRLINFAPAAADGAGTAQVEVLTWYNAPSVAWLSGKRSILRLNSVSPNFVPGTPYLFTWP